MGRYELIVILDASREEEVNQRELESIGEVVSSNQGEVSEVQPWGKRKLAYEIKGHRDGFYVSMFFSGGSQVLAELDRSLKLNESVLRHIVLRSEGAAKEREKE